jgi:carboxyl-terminal processing protease
VLNLQDGFGLKLTTARYFTPSGRSIQGKGITPDIELENISLKKDEDEDSIDLSQQEKDLKNSLSAEEVEAPVAPSDLSTEEIIQSQDNISDLRDEEYVDLLKEDYFVHEAMNVLKALKIYKK